MVREQAGTLREGVRRRGSLDTHGPLIDRAERLDRARRVTIQAVEERKAARNSASQEVARKKKAGENADELVATARELGAEISRLEAEAKAAALAYHRILVPLDHTALDHLAVGHAAAMARFHAAKLYLLHVEEGVTSQVYGPAASTAEVEAGEQYLERIAQLLRDQGLAVETTRTAKLCAMLGKLGPIW